MLLVEDELFTLLWHLSSHPDFNRVRWARFLYFYVVFCILLFVCLYYWAIVMSDIRNTASDYPYDIFKPFFLESSPIFEKEFLYICNMQFLLINWIWFLNFNFQKLPRMETAKQVISINAQTQLECKDDNGCKFLTPWIK